MKDGQVDDAAEVVLSGWTGQGDDYVGHSRNLGGERYCAVGEGGERSAGWGKGDGEGFDHVGVELVLGVSHVISAPGEG